MSGDTVSNVKLNVESAPEKKGDETSEVFAQWKQRKQSIVSKSSGSEDSKPAPASLMRRRSTFKGIATSVTSLLNMRRLTKGRISNVGIEETKPKVKMENTYKLKPDGGKEFSKKKVEDVAENMFEKFLRDEKYNPTKSSKLACDLAVLIKNKVKELDFPRYKIICNVIIGQCGDQGMQTASRCLWDCSTDSYSTVTFRNNSLWAIATVHAVYYE